MRTFGWLLQGCEFGAPLVLRQGGQRPHLGIEGRKVAALPLETWNYKAQPAAIRHLGPMAQDFKAAFQIGETDTGIATVDADGVALAAIQGLNRKLEEKLKAKDDQIESLEQRLAELERLVRALPKSPSESAASKPTP